MDFNFIKPEHQHIHARLENYGEWARKKVKSGGITMSPIWKLGKSNARQWHQPEITVAPDAKDAQEIHRGIKELPLNCRLGIGWYYCKQDLTPKQQAKKMNISENDLYVEMHYARSLLKVVI